MSLQDSIHFAATRKNRKIRSDLIEAAINPSCATGRRKRLSLFTVPCSLDPVVP